MLVKILSKIAAALRPVSVDSSSVGVIQIVKINDEHYTSVWMFFYGVNDKRDNVICSSEVTSTRG